MRRRFIYGCILSIALCNSLTSCCRSRGQMWEDTKTCSRYVGKGVRSLFGEHVDSRVCSRSFDGWEDEEEMPYRVTQKNEEFVPLSDNEAFQSFDTKEYPISQQSPGDPGCKIPGIDGFYAPAGHLARLFQNVHFDTDHYTVQGSENVAHLREIAQYLANHRNTYVFVEGHADERGATAYNLALGAKRSNSVRNFLIDNGVHPDQLFTISYGLERPLAMGHDEPAWKTNRRAQFKIYDHQ
jgi:peptidoglycan-associated lipoprotein